MKKKNDKREGNQYDKIVKENIESIIPALMNSVLGFRVKEAVIIKEKLQQTKEKEADALRIITDPNGQKFILHLEFQVDDYSKMAYRMADYWLLLKAKYQLPVRQFVIFIGAGEPITEYNSVRGRQLFSISAYQHHPIRLPAIFILKQPRRGTIGCFEWFRQSRTGASSEPDYQPAGGNHHRSTNVSEASETVAGLVETA